MERNSPRPRLTSQRRAILNTLRATTRHPTADELYVLVRKRVPSISLGTIYRNLDVLAASGEIKSLHFGGQRHYDATVVGHHHVRCVKCGRIADVTFPALTEIVNNAHDDAGYDIFGYELFFTGLCPNCKHQTGATACHPPETDYEKGD